MSGRDVPEPGLFVDVDAGETPDLVVGQVARGPHEIRHAIAHATTPAPVPPGFHIPDGYAFLSRGACSARECGEPIAWARTPKGKTAPLNPDGSNHFGTCPAAARFHRPKAKP